MQHRKSKFAALLMALAPCSAPYGVAAQEAARAATPPAHDRPHSIGEKSRVAGVPNFGTVTPTLFRGAQPTRKGFESLSKIGVAIIVDLREGNEGNREEKEVTALGMKFVGIPWHCTDPEDASFAKFLTVIGDNPDKKIFVHCRAGVDRTGMMIAAYRIAEQRWTAQEALREMQAFGFSLFHQVMCYGLGSYEQRFPTVVSSSPAFQNLRVAEQQPSPQLPPKQ